MERPVALITGTAVGFGRGLAEVFAGAGFDLSLIDKRPELTDTVQATEDLGATVYSTRGDVTDDDVLKRLVDDTMSTFGRIDVLINNAGEVRFTPVDLPIERAIDDLEAIWRVNTRAPFVLGRLVMPFMIERGEGHIINIATDHIHTCGFPEVLTHSDDSTCQWASAPRRPVGAATFDVYDSSKWALNGFTQAWSLALRRHNVRVNNICLGATDSDMMRQAILTGRGRPATAEEIGSWMPTNDVANIVLELHREGPTGRSGDNVGIWLGHEIVLPPPHPVTTSR
ncbi:MAG: SDR family NAD(P)-dependent oxidoreductase [Actinomycetota bacterium]|nr:SDR family NAD(P)-dependent oxidoreductase [Actinomycetota bacterium]MDA2972773.1 SDR family NAD(P)-dependent oxidoreductase [Actinomycetota bacterium]MDA3002223.1 SDR family NAD(P)-dependent oxidoreductase [Actinomycetota bacterium]